jgi:gamma-glutamyl phosphate reductase
MLKEMNSTTKFGSAPSFGFGQSTEVSTGIIHRHGDMKIYDKSFTVEINADQC